MKTFLKILAVVTVVIIALLFIIPIVYKPEIIELTKKELNENVNADIDFVDIDLSLLKSFPNLSIQIEGLSVIGKDSFKKDTLVNIENISIVLDLISVIKNDGYVVKKIALNRPYINIIVPKEGKPNYDISTEQNSNEPVATSNIQNNNQSSAFELDINKFQISDGQFNYADDQLKAYINMKGINHSLSGKLFSDKALLLTDTRIASLNLSYDGIDYLTNTSAIYKANIDADMANEIYTLGKNELILNELLMFFDGSVSFVGKDDLNIVLTFNSSNSEFKNILSLVPAVYSTNFKDIETEGTFSIDGHIKGIYNETEIPSFNISASIENGQFKYPELPKSVTDINMKSNISNKGGDLDNTIINISEFSMNLGENPFSTNLFVENPISDPIIDAKFVADFNLKTIKDFYPLEEENELEGNLIFDLMLKGKLSSIENEEYNDFSALGFMQAKNIVYNSDEFSSAVNIKNAQLNFSPQYLDLVNFNAAIGKNNLQSSGKIENYLAYYLNDGTLKGNITTTSTYLNIDKLFAESENESIKEEEGVKTTPKKGVITINQEEDSTSLSVVEIPANINFTMSSSFDEIIYDKIEMQDVSGQIVVNNQTLSLNNLKMKAAEGNMTVNGTYSTVDIEKPEIDLNLKMNNLNIASAYQNFTIIKKYLPLANKTVGDFSANFKVSSILDDKMMPDYSTLNGIGDLSTSKISIEGLNSLIQIADILKLDDFKKLDLEAFLVKFQFESGKLIVKPTKFKYKNINAEMEGWTGMDQSIGYDLALEIPREEFGSEANKLLDGLLSQVNSYGTNFSLPDKIPININIGGTLSNPTIKSKLSDNAGSSATEVVKVKVEEEIDKQKEIYGKEAQKIINDAEKQAKHLIKEGERQAKYINDNAADVVAQLNKDNEKQSERLIEEGKKKWLCWRTGS